MNPSEYITVDTNTIEIKFKDEGKRWEDIIVTTTRTCITHRMDEANFIALQLANRYQVEVRWNWTGSSQGHYVAP